MVVVGQHFIFHLEAAAQPGPRLWRLCELRGGVYVHACDELQRATSYPLHERYASLKNLPYSDANIAKSDDFGWEIAHAGVSRRPPISLYRAVARTHMYTYAAEVWDSSIVQGPFPLAPRQTKL
jgi:hypothetical protein